MFALVRHAHAGDKKRWAGPDDQRPLSRRGEREAEGVADNLSAFPTSRLLSSSYLRCRQTLAPVATRLRLPITACEQLQPDAPPGDLDRLLAGPGMAGAVLCTHGETLNGLFELWRTLGGLRVSPDEPDDDRISTQKGAVWILRADGDARIAHYLRPLSIGPVSGADADEWS